MESLVKLGKLSAAELQTPAPLSAPFTRGPRLHATSDDGGWSKRGLDVGYHTV